MFFFGGWATYVGGRVGSEVAVSLESESCRP